MTTTMRLDQARACTDELFRLIPRQVLYERPIPERHRIIFYLGHLEAFDWNLVCRGALGLPSFQPEFDHLFAFGIDPVVGSLPADQPSDWPAAQDVIEYGARIRKEMDAVLAGAPAQVVDAAIEHRLMHAETLVYMLHNMPLAQQAAPAPTPHPAPKPVVIGIPSGTTVLGLPRGCAFGWDNEFEEHSIDIGAFAIDKYKVTNQQYLDFVRAGADPPHFWRRRDGEWFYRAVFGEIPLPLSWPVYVTHEQASQYAAWAGRALPTEAQFHRAAYGTPDGRQRPYPWGNEPPGARRGNFDFGRWDPVPVDATPQSDSAFGVSQLVGNGWEWTSTIFAPFPGFEPFPFYPGYSADFFDGAHYVLKGGSARTAAALLRRSFRNWFRPNYPHVYAGFRCVDN